MCFSPALRDRIEASRINLVLLELFGCGEARAFEAQTIATFVDDVSR
jgi:hypothetical protein